MNLIEGLHSEMDRVMEIIKVYKGLPENIGALASIIMENDIEIAENAIATGDTISMLSALENLKENKL